MRPIRQLALAAFAAGLSLAGTSSAEPESPGAPPLARRLTAAQYRSVIHDVFGATVHIEGQFEPEVREAGLLAVGAGRVGVTASGLEQYDAMARGIAAQVVDASHRGTLVPCVPRSAATADPLCARRFFERAGPLLYRRALTEHELRGFIELASRSATALASFYEGLALSLAGLLESPPFLFRIQTSEPDPERPGTLRLDGYSSAAQLSFLLWNAGPDPLLMQAAAAGALGRADSRRREVDRLLGSPRLEAGIRAFFSDMLQFERFDTLAKDAQIYPKWTVNVGRDAREQTLRTLVDQLLVRHGDYRDLFTTRRTFLTPLLGSVYRVPVPQNIAWQPFEFPVGDPRVGIQSHASFVALHSHEGLSSPTLRGKALREIMLCEPIPAPPGNVNFAAAQDTHDPRFRTMRERLSAHRNDPTCAGCHKLMDPIGLALENFDSDAGLRTTENGARIETGGELDGVSFTDPAGLGRAIHDNPATPACLVRRLYSYATGRAASRRDMPWIRSLEQGFAADGYRVPELLRRLASSPNLYRISSPPTLVAGDPSFGDSR